MQPQITTITNYWLNRDFFFLGGISLFTCLAFWSFTNKATDINTISHLAFGLAFVFNHPHFLSSYVLLYRDFSKNFRQARYIWSGVLVPIFLLSTLIYCLAERRSDVMANIINFMYFTVGWHYVKQVFGAVIVTSVSQGSFYTSTERHALLANLYALWGISFFRSQIAPASYQFYGITYNSLELPAGLLDLSYAIFAITFLAIIWIHLKKYIQQGQLPAPGALAAVLGIYVWYLPTFAHPAFAYLIPLFHSMQYLYMVNRFKYNQVDSLTVQLEGAEKRSLWISKYVGFFVLVFVLGALAFEFIPKALDGMGLIKEISLGTSPILAATLIFINVHHYFIDNTIWRQSNKDVKNYLFKQAK